MGGSLQRSCPGRQRSKWLMPWFPGFTSAVELARLQTRRLGGQLGEAA